MASLTHKFSNRSERKKNRLSLAQRKLKSIMALFFWIRSIVAVQKINAHGPIKKSVQSLRHPYANVKKQRATQKKSHVRLIVSV